MKITLPSGRTIGEGHSPFIVAEVGSNWETLEHCLHSISVAKACGADAVKFQLFGFEALYGIDPNDLPKDSFPQANILMSQVTKYTLLLEWLPKLKEKADECGIEFMCSAFSPELVQAVDPFVNIHKVASAELTHLRILEKIAETKKPVFLSTGASDIGDVAYALDILRPCEVVLLHCVAAYPARSTCLKMIHSLEVFRKMVGFSDHSLSSDDIPFQAVYGFGARVLEKHFTAYPEITTPDQPHSLTPTEFKYMVEYMNGLRLTKLPSDIEELSMRKKHNRRLIVTQPISEREALEEGKNFGIYRSLVDQTESLSGFMVNQVSGRNVKHALKPGAALSAKDLL